MVVLAGSSGSCVEMLVARVERVCIQPGQSKQLAHLKYNKQPLIHSTSIYQAPTIVLYVRNSRENYKIFCLTLKQKEIKSTLKRLL